MLDVQKQPKADCRCKSLLPAVAAGLWRGPAQGRDYALCKRLCKLMLKYVTL